MATPGELPERIDKLGVTGSSPVPPIQESPPNGGLSSSPATTKRTSRAFLAALWLQPASNPEGLPSLCR